MSVSSASRSPPPPLAPPPSRETDVVFGVLLILTGVIVLFFFGYLVARYTSPKRNPDTDDSTEDPASTTTYKTDQFEYAEGEEPTDAQTFRLSLRLPQTVLRPLRL